MGGENLGNFAAQLGSIDARLNAIAGRRLPPLGPYIAQLGFVEVRLDAIADQIKHLPPVPGGYVNRVEPSSTPTLRPSDLFQNPNAPPPPGFERSPTGSFIPSSSTSPYDPGSRDVGHGVSASTGRPGLFGETYTPEQLNRPGRRFDPEGGGGNAFAAVLEDFADRIEKVFGADNWFAKVIRLEIPYLTSGAKSVFEVRKFLESAFIPFLYGLQNEIMSPQASAEMRELDNEIIRLIAGGTPSGVSHAGTLTPFAATAIRDAAARPTPSTTVAARTTFAGVSGDTRGVGSGFGATTSPVAAAATGATFTGVAAAVTSLHSTVSSANEEWRRQFNELRGQFLTQGGNIHELGLHFDARTHEMLSGLGDLRGLGAAQQQKVLDHLREVQVDVRDPARQQAVLDRLRQVQVSVTDPARQQRVLDRLHEVQSDFRERIDPRHLFQPVIDGWLRPLRENMFSPRQLTDALQTLIASRRLSG